MKIKTIACDVLVVGAGVSGVAAAIAAASKNSSVILLEKNKFPGGTAVVAMHNFICGMNRNSKGLLKQIIDRIAPQQKLVRRGKVLVMPLKIEKLTSGLSDIIDKSKHIKVYFGYEVFLVKKVGNVISSVVANYAGGKIFFKPKVVIDATGIGDVIKLSGAKYKISILSKRQLAGFSFKVEGINGNSELLALKVPYYLAKGVCDKFLPRHLKFGFFTPGALQGNGYIRLSIPSLNNTDTAKIVNKISYDIHNYLKKLLPEFRDSYITQVSPAISNREGLRLLGEYILSKEDVLSQRKFSDAVVKGYWPIEFWDKKRGPVFKYFKKNGFYEIPLRCLKSKNIRNLFATGRCISADPYALASTRVMATCISLGEAAGIAAKKYANIFN